ncbi:MAG: HIT family protein [Ectothiorhodospiraceae bacterium]|nr:HIT family protein [Ectothiorhodospiraceae bacterium]
MADNNSDPDCIFCKIVAGEIPAAIIFETDEVIAFMDAFPSSKGHALVIPRAHHPDVFEMPPSLLAICAQASQRLALASRKALQPDGMTVTQFNGAAAGQTVFHYHQHVTPRWEGQPRRSHGEHMADPEELKAIAAEIRAALD